ncbi:hypothetical protein VM1G_11838 [Cytospora mali]|uniref:F-box domain-containing protein n=1 Tax=Cytospora mali TaxID=578113 RepID=A0A194W748_CYTMA|nr:hypothetical protein VM1G_11838 [Valsa mali]
MVKSRGDHASRGQTLRSTKNTRSSSSWASIPREIRLMILEEISRQKHRGWASCAAVCKEWQVLIEQMNFYRLKLQRSCLQELEYMNIGSRTITLDPTMTITEISSSSRRLPLEGMTQITAGLMGGNSKLPVWEL